MYQHLQFKNILVALDGSDSSRMAYEVSTMKMLINWTKCEIIRILKNYLSFFLNCIKQQAIEFQ